jgi:hypothetical protein
MNSWAATSTLTAVSLLAGCGMLWLFGRFSDQEKIAQAKHRLRAHLYELRLFADDPVLMWRAQCSLLAWNLRYLRFMLRPALIVAVPTALLFIQLDSIYGRRPLRIGEPALVTAQLAPSIDLRGTSPTLELPAGVLETSPPVRVAGQRRVYWRVTARQAFRGVVGVRLAGRAFFKQVAAGDAALYLSARSVRPRIEQLFYPGEPRLPAAGIEWIEVNYPAARISVFGWRLHWLVWSCLVAFAAAFFLRKRMRVVF